MSEKKILLQTYTTCLSIEELKNNLAKYTLRCDYGINSTWRTFNDLSKTEAMLVAENGLIYMFGVHVKEDGSQTTIILYTWADKVIAESFLVAIENGQCVTSYSDPVLQQRLKQQ